MLECQFDRLAQPSLDPRFDDDAIDNRVDRMCLRARQVRRRGGVDDLAIDAGADEAGFADLLEDFAMRAFPRDHDRGQDHRLATGFQLHDAGDDRLDALLRDGLPTVGTMGLPGSRVEQSQVVIDLRRRRERAADARGGHALIDADGRCEPADRIDFGSLQLVQELPRVRRQAFEITPLAFGEDRVESE